MDDPGILSSLGGIHKMLLLNLIGSSALQKRFPLLSLTDKILRFRSSSYFTSILTSIKTATLSPHGTTMAEFTYFAELPPMPPIDPSVRTGMSALKEACGGGGGVVVGWQTFC